MDKLIQQNEVLNSDVGRYINENSILSSKLNLLQEEKVL